MSSGWKDVVKSGWQQGKESSSSLKSHVKGLVGRGDSGSSRSSSNYVATPRSALRDPASFAAPPKHVAAHGTGTVAAYTTSSHAAAGEPGLSNAVVPHYGQEQQQFEKPPAEPKPYRFDTTGLSTSHFPPPPRPSALPSHSALNPSAIAAAPAVATAPTVTAAKPRVPPSLPPRLPPRSGNNSRPPSYTGSDASSQGYLNQGAINSLGAAGISVPGLGIGGGSRTSTPTPQSPVERRPPPPRPTTSPSQVPIYGQVDELQARFARMGTSSSLQESSNGTTGSSQQQFAGQVPSVVGKKKPPPPPVPRKPGVFRPGDSADVPPPIPLATRPKF